MQDWTLTELLYVTVILSSSLLGHLGEEVVGLQTVSLSSFNCMWNLHLCCKGVRALSAIWHHISAAPASLCLCCSVVVEDLDLVIAYISEYASACCCSMTPEKGTWGPLVARDGITCLWVLVSCQTPRNNRTIRGGFFTLDPRRLHSFYNLGQWYWFDLLVPILLQLFGIVAALENSQSLCKALQVVINNKVIKQRRQDCTC